MPVSAAPPTLAAVFCDHMVLQRERPLPIWGWADPGSSITVEFAGKSSAATAGPDGKWMVRLPPVSRPPDDAPQTLTAASSEGVTSRQDILLGDVWICAGQSNMAFKLGRTPDGKSAAQAARNRLIRFCRATGSRTKLGSPPPRDLESAAWMVASPESVVDFSAVGYFFGEALEKSIGVPIGLIDTSVGGTPMRCWMSRESMESDPLLRPEVERCDADVKNHAKLMDRYQRQLASYQERTAKGDKSAVKPIAPKDPDSSYRMSYFHTSIIRPLQPLAIKGVIWYQGEANAGGHAVFGRQFSTLVGEWRREWGQGDFPWLHVQLAAYSGPNGRLFPRVWEAQSKAQSIPNSAMVVAFDHGVADDIHPPVKRPVGERLALAARGMVYGEKVNWRSPCFKSIERKGAGLVIHFDQVGDGLAGSEAPLKHFTIAGKDGNFVPAEARLNADNTVSISNPGLADPVAVRYGWYAPGGPVGASLYGRDGLPVAPFRTDDWPDRR